MNEVWFHEYGFSGGEDFEAAVEAIEALGFKFVYGGATKDPEWTGYPTALDAEQELQNGLADRVKELEGALEEIAARFEASPSIEYPTDAAMWAIARTALSSPETAAGGEPG